MTSNNEKFRALFLSALMVVSVFGAAVALTGGAAAAPADDFTVVNEGGDSLNVTSVTANDASNVTVVISGNSTYQSSADERLYNASPGSYSPGDMTADMSGYDAGTYTAYLFSNLSNTSGAPPSDLTTAAATQTVHVLADSAVAQGPNDGDRYWQGQDQDIYDLTPGGTVSVMRVTDSNDTGYPTSSSLEQEKIVRDDGTINLDTGNIQSGNYYLSGANAKGKSDVFAVAVQDLSAELDDGTVELDDSEEIEFTSKRGSWDMYVTSSGADVSELNDLFSDVGTGVSKASDDDYDVKVTGVQADTYDLTPTEDNIDTGSYDLEFEVVDTEVTDSVSLTINEAGTGSVDLATSSVDVAQGDVAEITLDLSNTDKGTLLIGNGDDDGYQMNVSVEDDGDDQVTLYFNTFAAANGDYSESDVIWVDDTDEDDKITDRNEYVAPSDEIIDAGSYELATVTGAEEYANALDTPDNIGTLYVEERSTDAVSTWVASSSNAENPDDLEEFTTAVDNDQITESSSVAVGDLLGGAKGDTMVIQVSATGLEGMTQFELNDNDDGIVTSTFEEALTTYNDTADSVSETNASTGFSLTLEEADPGANRNAQMVDFNSTDIYEVYYDGEGNYYVVAHTTDIADDVTLEDGDTYDVNFDVKDQFLLDYSASDWSSDDTDNWDSVSTDVTFEEPSVSFDVEEIDDTDYVTVNAGSGQAISGSTNVAPGSEITIRATGSDEARFVKSASEVVVQPDGTFSAEFDFSDRAVDEEFTARASGATLNAIKQSDQEADGLIVEAVEETTTTTEETTTEETTTEETTTEETTTEETTTEETTTEETTTPTQQQTPGFGIAVAMLALIGAALIALRRRD